MGTPMARRLLGAGQDVTVWNRTPARAEPLAAAGARVAADPAGAVRDADTVITMLADPPAVAAVVAEIVPSLRPGARLIEMSTVGPDAVREVARQVPGVIDAPVMGSVDRAACGSLIVLAGGDSHAVEGILSVFGTVVHCGPSGAGAARKILLINAVTGALTLVADLQELAGKLGVPDPLALLAEGPLAGAVARARAGGADFPIRLAAKDAALALSDADLPVLAAARDRMLAAPDQDADIARLVG
jgi:3-hydroxyisobutyrate dehydrogenase